MYALVKSEGSIEKSVAGPGGQGVTVDWKAYLMVLKKYKVNLAGISETKWFGKNVYWVDGIIQISILVA